MSPSQKTGDEIPKSTNPIAILSAAGRRFTAERTPTETPTMIQIVAAPSIRSNVRGARSRTSLEHGDAGAVRVAEPGPAVLVTREEVLHEDRVLLVPRLVESQPITDQRQVLRRRRLSGEPQCRIAGRHAGRRPRTSIISTMRTTTVAQRSRRTMYRSIQNEKVDESGALRGPAFRGECLLSTYDFTATCASDVNPVDWSKSHLVTLGPRIVTVFAPHVRDPRHDVCAVRTRSRAA